MIYTVHIDGNAQKNFSTREAAIKYATSEIYCNQSTLIDIRDKLDDGRMAQWAYGFRTAAIWANFTLYTLGKY